MVKLILAASLSVLAFLRISGINLSAGVAIRDRFIMIRTVSTLIAAAVAGQILHAQSVPLAEVEIKMARDPHSCSMSAGNPCDRYEIAVRGDGAVEYNGIGVVEGNRKRTIEADVVVALVNEFLSARFFDALDAYTGKTFIVRQGNTVTFNGTGGSGPRVTLSLRIGERRKSVRLERDYPAELAKLPELVDQVGGPATWK